MRLEEHLARTDGISLEALGEALGGDSPGRLAFVLESVGRGRRVLDLGCRGGRISLAIAEANNEVIGVELNEAAARVARGKGLRVVVADIEKTLPFSDGEFHAVHAGRLLEHVYDTRFVLSEVTRVLAPGGVFVASVANLGSLRNRLRVLSGKYVAGLGAYPEDHFGDRIRLFNLSKVSELCRTAGLQILATRGFGEDSGRGVLSRAPLGRILPSWAEVIGVRARKPISH